MQVASRFRTPARITRARRLALAVALAGLGLASAACGGGTPSSSGVASLGSTSTTTTSTSPATAAGSGSPPAGAGAKLLKFVHCMRKHGIANFPLPQVSNGGQSVSIQIGPGTGVDPKSPTFHAAQAACRGYLPNGGTGPTITPADQADYLKAVACMRSHGIANFPDPEFSHGSVRFVLPSSMDPNSTQFRKARLICEKLIPAGLPYSS